MLPPVERQNDNLFPNAAEIDRVGKAGQHRSSSLAVRSLERQRIRRHPRHEFIHGQPELRTEPFASRFVPLAHFKRVILGLRPENNPPVTLNPTASGAPRTRGWRSQDSQRV